MAYEASVSLRQTHQTPPSSALDNTINAVSENMTTAEDSRIALQVNRIYAGEVAGLGERPKKSRNTRVYTARFIGATQFRS